MQAETGDITGLLASWRAGDHAAVVAIDLAVQRLAALDERKSNVLEMRLFGGRSIDETAAALGIAPNTMLRDWNFARAWLRRELSGEGLAKSESREAD
jgi:DNA-directed RNA polymerase specialized sigma24 family protein